MIPSASNSCIPGLETARTRLIDPQGNRYDFWGLFCNKALKKGDFIGMYNGMWRHAEDSFEFGNRYAIELSFGITVAPPGQRPDPRIYPIAMANEPRPGTTANSVLHEWVFGREDVELPKNVREPRFYGVGLVACEDIPKGTEICWHYGASYGPIRDYPVGAKCVMGQVKAHPPAVLGHKLPYDSVSPTINSPSNSSDSDSDPTYKGAALQLVMKLLTF